MAMVAIILIHLLGAAGLYLFFTYRFNQALERSRRETYGRELGQNIELAVKFINSAIELVDKKSRTSYEMLRKAEQILTEIEARTTDRGAKKKGSRSGSKGIAAKERGTALVETKRAEAAEANDERQGKGQQKSNHTYPAERALEKLNRDTINSLNSLNTIDTVEISPLPENAEAIYQHRALSSDWLQSPEPPAPPPGNLPENLPGEIPGDAGNREQSARQTTILSGSLLKGLTSRLQRFLSATSTPARDQPSSQRPPKEAVPSQPPPLQPTSPALQSLYGEGHLHRKYLPSLREDSNDSTDHIQGQEKQMKENRAKQGQEKQMKENQGKQDPDLLPEAPPQGAERRQWLQSLLKAGYPRESIAAMTGIDPAEIELLRALPARPVRPRKKRLV